MPYEYPPATPDTDSSEESGGDAALGEEGPTECDCEPGEPGFAGFAGPKVQIQSIVPLVKGNHLIAFMALLLQSYTAWPA